MKIWIGYLGTMFVLLALYLEIIDVRDKNTKLINNNEKLISIICDTKNTIDKKNIVISNLRYEIEELKAERIIKQINGIKLEKAYVKNKLVGYFISKDSE